MKSMIDWQRRFRAGPAVWAVLEEGFVLALYESEEAAKHHLEWGNRHSQYPYYVRKMNIHTLDLAKERWADTDGENANAGKLLCLVKP